MCVFNQEIFFLAHVSNILLVHFQMPSIFCNDFISCCRFLVQLYRSQEPPFVQSAQYIRRTPKGGAKWEYMQHKLGHVVSFIGM